MFFAIEAVGGVHLYSYDMYNSDAMKEFIYCLDEAVENNVESSCSVNYEDISPDGFEISYTYEYNATFSSYVFVGYGEGDISKTLFMTIDEYVASSITSVLEQIYGPGGTKLTPYDTALLYKEQDSKHSLAK